MIKIIIGVIIAAVVMIGGFLVIDPNSNISITDTSGSSNTSSYTIEGEVSKPGTYVLKDNITMDDLITAAGGLTSNSDERSFYMTTSLTAGGTYYVGGLYDSTDVCSSEAIEKVNINEDSAEELKVINGITSSIASSIVSHRSEIESYTMIEELLDVYGIGNATYRKIRNYVILHE